MNRICLAHKAKTISSGVSIGCQSNRRKVFVTSNHDTRLLMASTDPWCVSLQERILSLGTSLRQLDGSNYVCEGESMPSLLNVGRKSLPVRICFDKSNRCMDVTSPFVLNIYYTYAIQESNEQLFCYSKVYPGSWCSSLIRSLSVQPPV